ncbi:SET domain-containing protein SmydA-8 [Diachasma alloeum]|uniref:SET domain-containing protein SmydA-8 n=1 Tax=Diachasma alloeum TaxID=454923 RepID=UPI000738188E|nr:SET domain-containing protein SmydA-8 [Diachasma alloeum]
MGGEEGICEVCASPANLRCTGCKTSFYCTPEHQKRDWSHHKSSCRSWSIQDSPTLGRHLVSTRDLDKDDVIISEAPIAFGPGLHSDQRVCVGCGDPRVAVRCPGCAWFACRLSCEGLLDDNRHGVECKLLAKARIIPRCDILLPLRMVILKKRSPKRWEALSALQSHEESRGPGTEAHEEAEAVFQQLEPILQAFSMGRDVISKVCGLIDVNGLETNPPEGSVGIYQTACLLEHQCLANTRHGFILDSKGRPKIVVKALKPIKKGEHLSTTYTHVLWATRARREHLQATKYFSCRCGRCEDPTELGSHLGTLKCPCGAGVILPKDPLDPETEWSCDLCPGLLTSQEVFELTERLGEEVENVMALARKETLSDLYSRLLVLLHPGHQHCIAVGHSLIQLLPSEDPKKIEICRRILETTSILDPHGGRLALYTAVALRELSSCPGEDATAHLTRAIELLRHEPAGSPGDNLKKLIESEL